MRRWFLLAFAVIGLMTLVAMVPPRVPSPPTGSEAIPLAARNSPLATPSILSTDPIRGNPNAPLTIIEYGDFSCPSCTDAQATLNALRTAYGSQLRIVWKDFPILDRITGSRSAHITARCAQQQGKFWEYHDALFTEQPRGDAALIALARQIGLDAQALSSCLIAQVPAPLIDEHIAEAKRLAITTAPTFFVNGTRLDGHATIDDFRDLLRSPTP